MTNKKDFTKLLTNPIFKEISEIVDELGMEAYLIGGFVRDIFLERTSKDIDIVTIGRGIEVAQILANKLGKKAKLSVFKNFGTAHIKYKNMEIEFVGARKESYQRDSRKPIIENGTLQDDQNRRDFTINALAICINKDRFGELLDPFDGVKDIKAKILRTPLDPDITFSDDPLRMMRGIRFASQLDFKLDPDTLEAITRNSDRIKIISKERIIEELNKIVLSTRPSVGFKLLSKTGLLPLIFKELEDLKGAETKDGVGHKDNFFHTLQVLDNISKVTDNLWLRWAAILHDIGKPATKKFDKKYGWTFYNHNLVGMKLLYSMFRKMKLPLNENLKYVQKLVFLHMRPQVLVDENITDSAVRRLLFEAGDDIDDLMTLCEADITSKNESKVQKYLSNFKIVRQKLKEIEEKDNIRNFQPLIDGDQIMQIFDLKPSQVVGVLKQSIKDAILDGIIENNYDQIYNFLISRAKKLGLTPLISEQNDISQTKPKLCTIVAVDENFAIGKDGGMLTHLPSDLKYFKEITNGHTVVMGRKTFDSLPKGALPNRRNIVITKQKNLELKNCIIINSFEELADIIKQEDIVFILGGGEIFNKYIGESDLLYITRIHDKFDGAQVFFPEIDFSQWELFESQYHDKDEKNPQAHTFEKYKRKK